MRLIIPLLLLILLLSSCAPKHPINIEEALDKMSTENRDKFEKVFDFFRSEEQKLQAAYELVVNINDYSFYSGEPIQTYEVLFDVLEKKPKNYRHKIPWYSKEVSNVIDSLETTIGPFDSSRLRVVNDTDAISSDFLINYINQAFKARQNPWAKEVSFEDFCNYVLPYRNNMAKLEDWRSMILEKYKWIYDSIKPETDILEVAKLLNKDTELAFSNGLSRYPIPISTTNILRAGFGNCPDMSNYKAMVMRAFGIPTSIDYIPQWGDDHQAHTWNSIQDKHGNWVDFGEVAIDSNARVAYKYRLAKVFRKTLHKNQLWLDLQATVNNELPSFFSNARNTDVTRQYVPVTNVNLQMKGIPKGKKVVYLCTFNNKDFTAVDFAIINKKKLAVFTDVGRNLLYFPMYYSDNTFISANEPFIITKKGAIQHITPEKNTQKMVLTRKYHLYPRKVNWLKSLVGGKFQGANKTDFSDTITIASINKIPSQHYESLQINIQRKFKYYRFLFDKNELKIPYDGDGAGISEIEWIGNDGSKLIGKPFGTPGKEYNIYTPELAFDGNVLTFFEDARDMVTSKWVGTEFKTPRSLSKIKFRARNDLNNVQVGDSYELFYWGAKNFVSLGQKVAKDTLLIYENIPKGGVYLLRNLSHGTEERVFTYEKDKQVWW